MAIPQSGSPPGYFRTADLFSALSLAADLAIGVSDEHAVRSCYIAMRIADALRLSPEERADLYYAELLMDAGCTAWTSQMAAFVAGDEIVARREMVFFTDSRNPVEQFNWMREYVAVGAPAPTRARRMLGAALHGQEFTREGMRNTCEVAQHFARRLGMPETVQAALLSIYEQWDGSGPLGNRGEAIPIISRIVYMTSFLEAFHHLGGPAAAIRLARQRQGSAFDPAVVEAFLASSADRDFWAGLEQESVWATVMALEPDSPYCFLPEARLDDVALAFADFADLKAPHLTGHSRRVADLAERVARRMALPESEITTIRRAALMHDLGLVAVPSFTLEKPTERLTPAEWERVRLHPYYAERILSRVPALAPFVPLVAAHHECPDGRGYHRGLTLAQIPTGARIIAVADRFDDYTHDLPGQPAIEEGAALTQLGEVAGHGVCADTFRSLTQVLAEDDPQPASLHRRRRQQEWPAGLTDREVEALRLLAQGLSRRQVADTLFLSEHTVRHHLEHIYNKVGVSTRVAAILFAVEHGLLR
ncbi:MAG: HD domain-containing phosphohydrolase [Thermomicrobiales bacterium]